MGEIDGGGVSFGGGVRNLGFWVWKLFGLLGVMVGFRVIVFSFVFFFVMLL